MLAAGLLAAGAEEGGMMGFSNGISEPIKRFRGSCVQCGAEFEINARLSAVDDPFWAQVWTCVNCGEGFCPECPKFVCESCGSQPRCVNCVTGVDEFVCWPSCQPEKGKE